jgi:hypothetical protein
MWKIYTKMWGKWLGASKTLTYTTTHFHPPPSSSRPITIAHPLHVVSAFQAAVFENTFYTTEQSPSWEANQFSASQEIPIILWNPKLHYRIYKRHPPDSILSFRKYFPTKIMYLIFNTNISQKKFSLLTNKTCVAISYSYLQGALIYKRHIYEGYPESKVRFAIKKYVLIIGKKTNMQVVAHTFTNVST